MIDIIVSLCLAAHPGACKDVRVATDNFTPFQCMQLGMTEASKLVAADPNWKVAKIACRPVSKRETDA